MIIHIVIDFISMSSTPSVCCEIRCLIDPVPCWFRSALLWTESTLVPCPILQRARLLTITCSLTRCPLSLFNLTDLPPKPHATLYGANTDTTGPTQSCKPLFDSLTRHLGNTPVEEFTGRSVSLGDPSSSPCSSRRQTPQSVKMPAISFAVFAKTGDSPCGLRCKGRRFCYVDLIFGSFRYNQLARCNGASISAVVGGNF